MKPVKLMLILGVLNFGFTAQSFAQKELPEITIVAVNYKYLNAVDNTESALPIKNLEGYAAAYDIKNADFYEDDYNNYFVSFLIPDGKILAAYDKDGKLLRTAEKFKNTALPSAVRQAVAKRFPQWTVTKDAYLVTYHSSAGVTKKYKLLLENGNKRMRVKIDDAGEFIN